jgi:hypothetical protein
MNAAASHAFVRTVSSATTLDRLLLRSSEALESLAAARMERRSTSGAADLEHARRAADESRRVAAAAGHSRLLPR